MIGGRGLSAHLSSAGASKWPPLSPHGGQPSGPPLSRHGGQPVGLGVIFRSWPFWAIALTHFACCAAHSGPIFHLVTHAIDQGVAKMSAASLLGLSGLSSIFGPTLGETFDTSDTFFEWTTTLPSVPDGDFDPATVRQINVRFDTKFWTDDEAPPTFSYDTSVFEIDAVVW